MFHGFYNLASGMLSQSRNLNVISNNMVNISTPGFKKDSYISSTFRDELISRSGNQNKQNPAVIGNTSMVKAPAETVVNFSQGSYQESGNVLDFALSQPGFFQVQTQEGILYTRNGSFIVDDEGYLAVSGVGRVLGANGPIQLPTDDIVVENGIIYDNREPAVAEDGTVAEGTVAQEFGRIQIVDFEDYTQLTKTDYNMFQTNAQAVEVDGGIMWKVLESSNVNPIGEMTVMMSSQRSLQSAAQMLKIYDQLMGKAVTEIGRV